MKIILKYYQLVGDKIVFQRQSSDGSYSCATPKTPPDSFYVVVRECGDDETTWDRVQFRNLNLLDYHFSFNDQIWIMKGRGFIVVDTTTGDPCCGHPPAVLPESREDGQGIGTRPRDPRQLHVVWP